MKVSRKVGQFDFYQSRIGKTLLSWSKYLRKFWFSGKTQHFGMNSGHHMAHVKKKVGRHEILFSRQRKRFCVKFVSQEKKISTKKKVLDSDNL